MNFIVHCDEDYTYDENLDWVIVGNVTGILVYRKDRKIYVTDNHFSLFELRMITNMFLNLVMIRQTRHMLYCIMHCPQKIGYFSCIFLHKSEVLFDTLYI